MRSGSTGSIEQQGNDHSGENRPGRNDDRPGRGHVCVAGLGPGDLELIPPLAREAIREADLLIGYQLYIDLIEPLIDDQRVHTSGPWDTVDRARKAVAEATEGCRVTVVSSGDPQIYGMASPVLEIAAERDVGVDVLPGITALSAAASRIGSPLTNDFAAISLSDHLVEWDKIEQRISGAGIGDFVICFYNPRSKRRPDHLSKALDLLSEHRCGNTPTAVIRNVFRDNESIIRTTLNELDVEDVDMLSTVIIGNSSTYFENGEMISPRGYHTKSSGSE